MTNASAIGGAFVRINSTYSVLLTTEKKVADYILRNKDRMDQISIGEIAQQCGVSNAAVTRFCKRLGYKGFKDFRLSALKDSAASTDYFSAVATGGASLEELSVDGICDSNAQACMETKLIIDRDILQLAAQSILTQRRIFILGEGAIACAAMDLYQKLLRLGLVSLYSADRRMQKMHASIAGPQDVFIAFDLSGNTRSTVGMVEKARAGGARTIAICNTIGSPLSKAAQYNLYGPGRTGSDITGTLAPRIALLCIVDCLFFCLKSLMGDACRDSIKKTSQVIREDWV